MIREIVGFSGSSRPVPETQRAAVHAVLAKLRAAGAQWLHHGDCVNADAAAHNIWWGEFGGCVEVHPPTNNSGRAFCAEQSLRRMTHESGKIVVRDPLPYLDRNAALAAASTVLVAAPARTVEELRSGTWATVRYARRRGSWVLVCGPDGSVRNLQPENPQPRLL